MTTEHPEAELPPRSVPEALRNEVAARARKGAFLYPVVGAILVRATEIWQERRAEGLAFVGLLLVAAVARNFVTRQVSGRSSDRAHRALVIAVTLQSLCWGSFVAAISIWFGLVPAAWLAFISAAGFSAGGTSSMGIDPSVHRPFIAGMAAPIAMTMFAAQSQTGIALVVVATMYCWFLLHDARQHAQAFDALLRAQHELRFARDRARAADRAKSDFLAMMSHEIRTPMHAAVGTASMLLETNLDERQRRYTETIVRAGETLGELINDVLDISRMDAQGAQLDAADFELKTALLEVVQMFEPLARRAQLEFKHELADSTAISVSGDKRRLQQILVNLIGNAIKFTEQGEVTLTASARDVRAGFEITAIVADSGIGIHAAQLERVFQPFEQADSGIARKYGGTGLGLAISKRLAETMGGRIDVASVRGKGTTFTVLLQLATATRAGDSEADVRSNVMIEGAVPPGTRVLVVDDSELNRDMAREMLERLRCVAETVSSGAEAIAACQKKEFDIVLMDCQMRDLDGYATTRQLRALDNAIARAPIVAVTANAFDDDRRRAFDAGMNDLLAKPFGIRELHRTLSRWLVTVGEPPSALQEKQSQPASTSLYPHAMQHMSSMLEGSLDEDVVDRVVEAFLQQWPRRLTALNTALEQTDLQTLRQIVHTLEGAVPYFGIEKLNEALRSLQQQVRAANIAGAIAGLPELASLVAELEASRKRHHAPRSA